MPFFGLVTVTDSRHSAPAQNLAIHNAGGIVKVSIPPDIVIMLVQALGRSVGMLGRVMDGRNDEKRLDGSMVLWMTRGAGHSVGRES